MKANYIIRLTPITKKNSQRIVINPRTHRPFILPSENYKTYEARAGFFLRHSETIDRSVNIKILFYMPTHRRVDLTNLLEAADDILVKYGVIADDHSGIIVSHDGSRVLYDKVSPRTEIYITEAQDEQEESS